MREREIDSSVHKVYRCQCLYKRSLPVNNPSIICGCVRVPYIIHALIERLRLSSRAPVKLSCPLIIAAHDRHVPHRKKTNI